MINSVKNKSRRGDDYLVATDLDGTLLDHETYSAGDTGNTIRMLRESGIPVVFNTSKTYAETLALQRELGVADPFIVENGSCVYLPVRQFPKLPAGATRRDANWSIRLGRPHAEISSILEKIKTGDRDFTRLSQCSMAQAVELTGLSVAQSQQAVSREFSEPIVWHADHDSLMDFITQLESHGLTTLQGGRFLHIIGQCDKGRALKALCECYDRQLKIVALGDSANDAAMLAIADIAIIVKSPSCQQLARLVNADILTETMAPAGWPEGIHRALHQQEPSMSDNS